MAFSMKLVALLLVAVVVVSMVDAQRGRGRGRGGGRRPGSGGQQGGDGQQGGGRRPGGSRGPQGGDGQQAGGRRPGGSRGPQGGNGQAGGRRPGGSRGPQGGNGEEAGGRRPGAGGRPERERPAGIFYTFNQSLSSGEVVKENVFLPENTSLVVAGNRGDRDNGIFPSRTIYDFSSTEPIVVIASRGPLPCLRIDTALSYADFTNVGLINNTLVDVALDNITLVAEAKRPDREEMAIFFQEYPQLKRFCRSGVINSTTTAEAGAYEGETREVKVMTFENEVTLTVRGIPAGGPGGRGKGRGGRGGSRGGSRRG